MKKTIYFYLCAAMCMMCSISAAAPIRVMQRDELGRAVKFPLLISAEKAEKIVKCDEKVSFAVDPVKIPENAAQIRIFQWINGLPVSKSDHPVEKFTVTMSSAVPAHLMVTGVYIDSAGKEISPPSRNSGYGDGVFVEPEKLARARKRPADFDQFWDNELKKLAEVPMQVKRTPYRSGENWMCDEVEITSIAGIPVTGFLVIPKNAKPKSLPVVVFFHGAGFKSSSVRREFGDKAIVFDVNAHGIKNGMGKDFYRQLNLKPPADRNVFAHRDNREESYFKNMFLRTVRAVDFVKTLPEWNGKTIIVAGRSQGGAQAIAAAALCPDATLCIANVPALADHGGKMAKRAPGWPNINSQNDPAIAAASDYIDVVNLAGRIRCETLISIGMIDRICPPTSVWMAYMEVKTPKSMTFFPQMGHDAPPLEFDGRKRITQEISR